ncbi:MAG: methyl-accepting chemotaxis protein [Alphaproteobacteria bacterium]|jgi:methyl-accepting chemotaxis protein
MIELVYASRAQQQFDIDALKDVLRLFRKNKGSESAQACLEKSTKTSQTFDEASGSVTQISDLNIQIAVATEEQSAVAEEINKNLINISHLADVTTEGAKTTSEANKTIAKRVIDLHTNLNAFVE